MSERDGALARCVGDADRFLAGSWGRRHHRHHDPARFADLLSLDDVDHLVASTGLRTPAFRLVKDGRTIPTSHYTRPATIGSQRVSDLADVGRVHEHVADGATLVLQGLHRYWPPLTRFCRDLELTLTHPVQANAYVTPPVAQGLQLHADRHHVFAVQTHGRKQWVVASPEGVSDHGLGPDQDREPVVDVDVVAGDCLYVPQGVRHAARTVDTASVHITIGVRTVAWADIERDALALVGEGAALPAGFAGDTDFAAAVAEHLRGLAERLTDLDADELAERARRRFWSARTPLLEGQLGQLLTLDQISDDTVLRRRPGAVCHVRATTDAVVVTLGDRELRMPPALGPVMDWIAGASRFSVGELHNELDEKGRWVLARRLVREGLLVVET